MLALPGVFCKPNRCHCKKGPSPPPHMHRSSAVSARSGGLIITWPFYAVSHYVGGLHSCPRQQGHTRPSDPILLCVGQEGKLPDGLRFWTRPIPHRGKKRGRGHTGHLQRACACPLPVVHNPVLSERSDRAFSCPSAVDHWLKGWAPSLMGPSFLVSLLIQGKHLVPALHDGHARSPHHNRGADH